MPASKPQEHDVVALLVDLPGQGLSAGDTGTIVHCYANQQVFEVEFMDESGTTKAVATVPADQLLKLNWVAVATK
jgi:hypothetical protein